MPDVLWLPEFTDYLIYSIDYYTVSVGSTCWLHLCPGERLRRVSFCFSELPRGSERLGSICVRGKFGSKGNTTKTQASFHYSLKATYSKSCILLTTLCTCIHTLSQRHKALIKLLILVHCHTWGRINRHEIGSQNCWEKTL